MSTAIGSGASKELRHAYDRVNFFFWTMSATTWQRGGGKRGDFDAKKVASLFIVDVVVNAQREETEETEDEDETPGLANSSEDAARCRRSARLLFDIFFLGKVQLHFWIKKDIFHIVILLARARERNNNNERCASNNNIIIIATMTIATITGWSPPISLSFSSYSCDTWYRIGTKWWPLKKYSRFATD